MQLTDQDNFTPEFLFVEFKDMTLQVPMDSLFRNEFKCYKEYVFIDEKLEPSLIDGKVDVNHESMIQNVQRYHHTMEYTPKLN